MVDAMFSTISMATSLRFLGSMFHLFALWEEELMVLFGKEQKQFCGVVVFCWIDLLSGCFCCL